MSGSHSKRNVQYVILSVFFIANVFVWLCIVRADRAGILTVAFLDVDQGDAIYIEAPNGNQVLIDGGPSGGTTLRALGGIMPFWDHSLDMVIATHPDQDHVGGLSSVIDRMQVSRVVTTENTAPTGAYGAFEKAIDEKHITRLVARTGERVILDSGIVLEILFPDQNAAEWEPNTSSIIARLSYGTKSFLFTGDSPQSVEKYLLGKKGASLNASVLKLGHHGSKTSSSKIFLSAVSPEYAIVSAGKNNKYGHPHQEVLDLLSMMNIKTVSTIRQRTVVFTTNGEELWENE